MTDDDSNLIEHLMANDTDRVRKDAEQARAEAERLAFVIEHSPTTPDAYRKLAVAEVSNALGIYRARLAGTTGFYRLNADALEAWDRAVWSLLEVLSDASLEVERETDRALRERLALMQARADAPTRINVLRALDDALGSAPPEQPDGAGDDPVSA